MNDYFNMWMNQYFNALEAMRPKMTETVTEKPYVPFTENGLTDVIHSWIKTK